MLWATGSWPEAESAARRALSDGRGGLTTRNTALFVLGYITLGRGSTEESARLLGEALEIAEQLDELQRLAPALWGIAELELRSGRPRASILASERALTLSEAVGDAAYAFPFVVTGVRALLELADPVGAAAWLRRCAALLQRRNLPGTAAALAHAGGLLQLAGGRTAEAEVSLGRAHSAWSEVGRFWEGTQALADRGASARRAHHPDAARRLQAEAERAAVSAGASALVAMNGVSPASAQATRAARTPVPHHAPLSAREFAVACLVGDGATNKEIALRLQIAPRTAATHVEHILTKLGAGRRAEIATWVSRHPAPGDAAR